MQYTWYHESLNGMGCRSLGNVLTIWNASGDLSVCVQEPWPLQNRVFRERSMLRKIKVFSLECVQELQMVYIYAHTKTYVWTHMLVHACMYYVKCKVHTLVTFGHWSMLRQSINVAAEICFSTIFITLLWLCLLEELSRIFAPLLPSSVFVSQHNYITYSKCYISRAKEDLLCKINVYLV